jgi:hypothetical protein
VGKTKRKAEMLYLDPEKLELMVKLSGTTRIPRAALWREALDDLLIKHGVLKKPKKS